MKSIIVIFIGWLIGLLFGFHEIGTFENIKSL